MTAASLLKRGAQNGPQPIDLTRHLRGLAQLMEACFSHEMDAGGRALVREMQFISHFGPLLALLIPFGLEQEAWGLGYVWAENGRVVGSVSTRRAAPRSSTWLIANVATHPAARRRGIARALMQATLEMIERQGGREILLQVDDDNAGATGLYARLGFASQTTVTAWTRSPRVTAPPPVVSPFDIRLRARDEWADEFALAQRVRPAGLAWSHPLRPETFRSTAWQWLDQFFSGTIAEHWVAENPQPQPGPRLAGSLTLHTGWSEAARLTLLVHPDFAGQLERPLLARGLRRLSAGPWSVRLEHPAHDEPAEAALKEFGFAPGRTLRWMQLEIK